MIIEVTIGEDIYEAEVPDGKYERIFVADEANYEDFDRSFVEDGQILVKMRKLYFVHKQKKVE